MKSKAEGALVRLLEEAPRVLWSTLMPPIISPFVSLAFSRLRRAVNVCCWVVACALLCQVLIWCFATFTDVRYESLKGKAEPGAIVVSRDKAQPTPILVGTAAAEAASDEMAVKPVDPNRVLSKFEPIFAHASSLSMAAGSIALLVLLPLVAVGLLLGVTSATNGVEHSVSAFVWSLVTGLFILPIGQHIGLPWEQGALVGYGLMTKQVELSLTGSQEALASATFYARFGLMPLVCVCAVAIIGLRFSVAVGSGIIPKESLRLDPVLEKEAANIKPSSLHGGRGAGAMRAALASAPERKPMPAASQAGNGLAATSAGEAPRRLI